MDPLRDLKEEPLFDNENSQLEEGNIKEEDLSDYEYADIERMEPSHFAIPSLSLSSSLLTRAPTTDNSKDEEIYPNAKIKTELILEDFATALEGKKRRRSSMIVSSSLENADGEKGQSVKKSRSDSRKSEEQDHDYFGANRNAKWPPETEKFPTLHGITDQYLNGKTSDPCDEGIERNRSAQPSVPGKPVLRKQQQVPNDTNKPVRQPRKGERPPKTEPSGARLMGRALAKAGIQPQYLQVDQRQPIVLPVWYERQQPSHAEDDGDIPSADGPFLSPISPHRARRTISESLEMNMHEESLRSNPDELPVTSGRFRTPRARASTSESISTGSQAISPQRSYTASPPRHSAVLQSHNQHLSTHRQVMQGGHLQSGPSTMESSQQQMSSVPSLHNPAYQPAPVAQRHAGPSPTGRPYYGAASAPLLIATGSNQYTPRRTMEKKTDEKKEKKKGEVVDADVSRNIEAILNAEKARLSARSSHSPSPRKETSEDIDRAVRQTVRDIIRSVSKSSSPRKPSDEDGDEELEACEWKVSCICGQADDDGEEMVGCDSCNRWEHVDCIFPMTKTAPESRYLCHACWPRQTLLTPDQARAYQDGVKEKKRQDKERDVKEKLAKIIKRKKESSRKSPSTIIPPTPSKGSFFNQSIEDTSSHSMGETKTKSVRRKPWPVMDYTLPSERNGLSRDERKLRAVVELIEKSEKKGRDSSGRSAAAAATPAASTDPVLPCVSLDGTASALTPLSRPKSAKKTGLEKRKRKQSGGSDTVSEKKEKSQRKEEHSKRRSMSTAPELHEERGETEGHFDVADMDSELADEAKKKKKEREDELEKKVNNLTKQLKLERSHRVNDRKRMNDLTAQLEKERTARVNDQGRIDDLASRLAHLERLLQHPQLNQSVLEVKTPRADEKEDGDQ